MRPPGSTPERCRSTFTSPTRTSSSRTSTSAVRRSYHDLRRDLYWFPKMTGHMYNERLGEADFWLTFIGFNVTFFRLHWLGSRGSAAHRGLRAPLRHLNMIISLASFRSAPRSRLPLQHDHQLGTGRRRPEPVALDDAPSAGLLAAAFFNFARSHRWLATRTSTAAGGAPAVSQRRPRRAARKVHT